METRYASAERMPDNVIDELFALINTIPFVNELLAKTMDIMFVLNKERQVVFSNQTFMDMIGVTDIHQILGKRPGEALGCVHSDKVSGCGTSEFCVACDALNAVLESQRNDSVEEKECMLSLKGGASLELKVVARPFEYMGERFTFFTAKDIGDSKRKTALERIFFHDILNLASSIHMVIDLYSEGEIDELSDEVITMLRRSSSDMMQEIEAFRALVSAEKNELIIQPKLLVSSDLIEEVAMLYKKSCESHGMILEIKDGSLSAELSTDPSLLKRILINMIKNAIEASGKGDIISVWCEKAEDGVVFKVNNPAVMTENVRIQIFKRSFTTKESGTGLGTYSMKLLSENYLGGSVDFSSKEGEGTTFKVFIPLSL